MTARARAATARRKTSPARKPMQPGKRKVSKTDTRPRRTSGAAKPRNTSASATRNKAGRPLKYYTPEFLAEARRQVERTAESMTAIAGKLGIHHSVLSRLIKREGWVRSEASPRRRGLSPAMRLVVAADALVTAGVRLAPRIDAPAAGGEGERRALAAHAPHDLSAVDRLEQGVLRELATVEAMRASLGSEPLRPMDAERTARTLSVLTETLSKLRRMRLAAAPQAGSEHDDFPADIDAFRLDLARRIERSSQAGLKPCDADGDPRPAPTGRRLRATSSRWRTRTRSRRLAPNGGPWTTWLMLGGRGAGKTGSAPNGCARWRSARGLMPSTPHGTSRWSARPSTTPAR